MKWLACVLLLAQDYPQWRGPERDGSASGFRAPEKWPAELVLKWRAEVGEGYATPIVAGEMVYAFTRQEGAEVVTAFRASTGKIVWRSAYPAAYQMAAPTKAHGSGPKSTPLYYRGKLYTLGAGGIVSAFDGATGKLVWRKPAPAEQPFFGTASSPLADGGQVIFHPGNYQPLTAYDAGTGDVRWVSKEEGMYASPMLCELGGTRQIVTMGQKNIVGVSPADGGELWNYPWGQDAGGMQSITPIIFGDMVIAGSYHKGISALRPRLREGRWMVEQVWHTDDASVFLSNPVLMGGTLFGLSEKASGQYFALDAASGKILWIGTGREASNVAIVKAGELLFLLKDSGELTVARAGGKQFDPIAKYTVAESATWAQPAISGPRIFVKSASSLLAWTLD